MITALVWGLTWPQEVCQSWAPWEKILFWRCNQRRSRQCFGTEMTRVFPCNKSNKERETVIYELKTWLHAVSLKKMFQQYIKKQTSSITSIFHLHLGTVINGTGGFIWQAVLRADFLLLSTSTVLSTTASLGNTLPPLLPSREESRCTANPHFSPYWWKLPLDTIGQKRIIFQR